MYVVQDFAQDGLRTLCLAYKEIDPAMFSEWKKRHNDATYVPNILHPETVSIGFSHIRIIISKNTLTSLLV